MNLKQIITILNNEYRTKLTLAIQKASTRELQEVFLSLGENGPLPAGSGPESTAQSAEHASSGPSASEMSQTIARIVRTTGSASISDLAKALNVPKETLVRPLRLAIKSGAIKRVGEKWQARYVPA